MTAATGGEVRVALPPRRIIRVFWALHRHFDPSPQKVDDASAQAALSDLLLHALVELRP